MDFTDWYNNTHYSLQEDVSKREAKELERKDKLNEEFADFLEEKFHEFFKEKIKDKDAELPHTRLVYTYVKDGLVINHTMKPPKPPRVPSELEEAASNFWNVLQKYRTEDHDVDPGPFY